MRYTVALVAGLVMLVLGAQGGIRLIADHDNAGLLDGLPGGFAVQVGVYAAAAVAGASLAGWGSAKSKQAKASE
jgi:hypothetical protein